MEKKIDDVVQRAISKELNEQFNDLTRKLLSLFHQREGTGDSLTKIISTVVEEATKKTKIQLLSIQASIKTFKKKVNELEQ